MLLSAYTVSTLAAVAFCSVNDNLTKYAVFAVVVTSAPVTAVVVVAVMVVYVGATYVPLAVVASTHRSVGAELLPIANVGVPDALLDSQISVHSPDSVVDPCTVGSAMIAV